MPIWIITHSPGQTPPDVVRRLRVNVLVVHAKYQCFRVLLNLMQDKKLVPAPGTAQKKQFEKHLAELASLFLYRKRRNGLPMSEILQAALSAEDEAMSLDDREVILDLFEAAQMEHNLQLNLQQVTGFMTTGEQANAVFVSYSHRDAEWLKRVRVHLKPLERKCFIRFWDDTRIEAGEEWRKEIGRALDSARLAILLVSAEFLASDFIQDVEVPQLLEAARAKGVRLIPVILSPSSYWDSPLGKYQSLNDPQQPLSAMSYTQQEQVFVSLYGKVKAAFASPPVEEGAVS